MSAVQWAGLIVGNGLILASLWLLVLAVREG